MPHRIRQFVIRFMVIGLSTALLAPPASAIDYEQLMKLKKDFEVVRDIIRKLRGRDPAPAQPTPPTPPAAPDAPAPGGTPGGAEPPLPIPLPAGGGLSFSGHCSGKDETGYAENARLSIADGRVNELTVRIDIPKRGSCRYQLAAFNQTKQLPFVELRARSDPGCALRMWQQGDRITFAATDCADKCTKGAFDYAWPVEFSNAGGCH